MTFPGPSTTFTVDKYLSYKPNVRVETVDSINPTLWDVIYSRNEIFAQLVTTAGMKSILRDQQTKLTIFLPQTSPKEILAASFETARQMVNSVSIKNIISSTTMMQSAFTVYQTLDGSNRLQIETPIHVQFDAANNVYNHPPYGIRVNNFFKLVIPDIKASNGIIHIVDNFPY